jgi:hypothetical protein
LFVFFFTTLEGGFISFLITLFAKAARLLEQSAVDKLPISSFSFFISSSFWTF